MIKKTSHSIDEKILEAFNKKAKKNAINKSQWIQMKMEEYLKEVEDGENKDK